MQLHCTDVPGFESERPVIFSLEEIEDATNNFDETRKIGEGGYGSVYFGVLGEQVRSICSSFVYPLNYAEQFFISAKIYNHNRLINHQEVAIKKMRSNKSKEFFAELKVLCKIHHINVVRNHLWIIKLQCDVEERFTQFFWSNDILGWVVGVCQWRRSPVLSLWVCSKWITQWSSSWPIIKRYS